MLTYFEAHNFKSIRALRLEMRPFMVLVGPNGAGKTNVVRALELFGRVLERGTTEPVRELGYDRLIRRGKRPASEGLGFTVHVEVPAEIVGLAPSPGVHPKSSLPLKIEATLWLASSGDFLDAEIQQEVLTLRRGKGALSIRLSGNRLEVQPGKAPELWEVLDSALNVFRGKVPKTSQGARALFLDALRQRSLPEEPERHLLRILNWQRLLSPWMRALRDSIHVTRIRLEASSLQRASEAMDILGPRGEGLAAAVERLQTRGRSPGSPFWRVLKMLQHVYPGIQDIRTHMQSGHLMLLFKEQGIKGDLWQDDVSDGVVYALALLVALEGGMQSSGLLAIEEPENAIHPWPLREMIGQAQQEPARQILLTTHSVTVVNAVREPRALFLVENDGREGTTVTPALEREAALEAVLRGSGQKLGEVWLDGSLGGVPTPRI